MIALTRGIGDSLLSLTAKVGGDTTSPAFEPETLAFESRVLSDGGKILDIEKLDRFIKANKSLGLYANLQFAVSKQFGYKVSDGNIVKIYDASKNGNDLDISRGTVAEDIEHDMFFLNNTFFKDESVTMDVIGDEFTALTDIICPDPEGRNHTYLFGFGDLDFGCGSIGNNGIIQYTTPDGRFRSLEESFTSATDANVFRKIDWRYTNGGAKMIRKDGVDQGNSDDRLNSSIVKPNKIVFGGQASENIYNDADSYLNNAFFYNKYLTDQELEDINDIL